MLNNDNDESRKMVEQCYRQTKTVINPIIDWSTEEVWEFIHEYNIPYCELYDKGYKRLGCIGCPMGTVESRKKDFERYPKYEKAYLKAFERMIANYDSGGGTVGKTEKTQWNGGVPNESPRAFHLLDSKQIMEWWIK